MVPEVHRGATLEEISRQAAEYICQIAQAEAENQNIFTLALAGGNTPRLLYEYLASPPLAGRMPWQKIHLFWGDERWVESDQHYSNFSMASRSLLTRVAIPAANIHRIPTELPSLQAAAASYEATLLDFFGPLAEESLSEGPGKIAIGFDLILLGMGEDGHTASLFPGSATLAISDRRVAQVEPLQADPPLPRLTLTLPAINSANQVLFLVAGARKLAIVEKILNNPEEAGRLYPAGRVQGKDKVLWFLADK